MRTRYGRRHLLDASAPGESPRARVAVVMQPAPAASLVDTLLLAHGLTVREREIATLVPADLATDAIATRLHLSPWTIQDHLKAVFERAGVRGRRALVARVGLEAGRAGNYIQRLGREPNAHVESAGPARPNAAEPASSGEDAGSVDTADGGPR